MTQISQFLLVVVGVAVAALWALLRKRSGKWLLLIVGSFVAWLVLPSVILQVKWGYYEEDGAAMAYSLGHTFDASTEYWIKRATELATENCGDAEGFDVNDPSLHWTVMAEQNIVRHFFRLSEYSNMIWLSVGWKDRFCVGRYLVTDAKELGLSPLPTQLFPYPFFPCTSLPTAVEQHLVERLHPPTKPSEGARPLLPGQCVTGEIARGDTLRFQAQMPYFGQKISLHANLECVSEKDRFELVEWTKNGRPIVGEIDESDSGGTYEIALRAPAGESKRYRIGVRWGTGGLSCHPWLESWERRCRQGKDASEGEGN
jgi:hypothetical protein